MLHVANGDIVAERLRASRLVREAHEVIAWRDVLHLGPVPAGLAPARLREVRARFLADRGWGGYAALLDDLARRDAALEDAFGELVLWFESDLSDQLQLVQVLDRVASAGRCSLVQVDGDGRRFTGFGPFGSEELAGMFDEREAVTDQDLSAAARAWDALRAPDPTGLEALDLNAPGLPYLADAVRRYLADFPAPGDGLSRTERSALRILDERPRGPVELFHALMEAEPRPFLGDAQFWDVLAELASGAEPLLEDRHRGGFAHPPQVGWDGFRVQSLTVTAVGRAALAGRLDRATHLPLDRWHGGVHLRGAEPAWRWDPSTERLIRGQRSPRR